MAVVGVLALQGGFEAHRRAFDELGAATREVRTAAELAGVDALVMPGGESTTMLKLIEAERLWEPLGEFGAAKPVFATCAGAILLAREVLHPAQASLGLADLTIERNAYGRQVHSTVARIDYDGQPASLEAVFIRAPIIRRVGEDVRVLGTYQGDPVLVSAGRHLIATFHPELTAGRAVQRRFLESIV
ncbi:MAG: pyridoxal 5'-phosphate synthase glutaminase subunit PdxT [Bryobacterales bacterium]|nr:pyridoxal 5'-phosphate synthase glutaminase subunit PdxT [Bryobacterales bacterium]